MKKQFNKNRWKTSKNLVKNNKILKYRVEIFYILDTLDVYSSPNITVVSALKCLKEFWIENSSFWIEAHSIILFL